MPLATILLWVGRALLAQFVSRLLVGAGLELVAYHYAVGPLFTYVRTLLSSSGSQFVGWIGYLNIDRAFTVLASAYTIRMARNSVHLGRQVISG